MPPQTRPGTKAPRSACRATAAEPSPWRISRTKSCRLFLPARRHPGCTLESKAFSALAKAFAKAGTAVLGVSADPVTAQDKFKAKHDLAIRSPPTRPTRLLDAYGVWAKNPCMERPSWESRAPPT